MASVPPRRDAGKKEELEAAEDIVRPSSNIDEKGPPVIDTLKPPGAVMEDPTEEVAANEHTSKKSTDPMNRTFNTTFPMG